MTVINLLRAKLEPAHSFLPWQFSQRAWSTGSLMERKKDREEEEEKEKRDGERGRTHKREEVGQVGKEG